MIVFVSGATGALGRPVVERLVAAGHTVRALSHSPESSKRLRERGAEPVAANLFDLDALRPVMAGCDAVAHLATRIPPTSRAGRLSSWVENDRIRREGTRNLVTAALDANVATFVYPSFAFVYPESGDAWIDAATTEPESEPTAILRSTLDAEREVTRFAAAPGRRGLSLRMGAFYGPEAPSAREQLQMARLGIAALPGRLDAYWPSIWVGDAADAVVAALSQGASGVYDVVDDEPLTRAELFAAMANAVGRKRLRRLPVWLMRLVGGVGVDALGRGLRISNRRFKAQTAWAPTIPNAKVGWARMA